MDDVRMFEGRHHLDFSVDQPTQIFVFDGFRVFGNSGVDTGSRRVRSFLPDEARLVDDFDGHEAPRNEQRLGQIDPGKGAFSEQLAELVKLFGRDAFDQPRRPTLPVSGSRRQRAGEAGATAVAPRRGFGRNKSGIVGRPSETVGGRRRIVGYIVDTEAFVDWVAVAVDVDGVAVVEVEDAGQQLGGVSDQLDAENSGASQR